MESTNQQRKIIEHYSFSLSAKIGKGFSSVVYQGRDDSSGETVAVKVIQMRLLEEDEIYKSLLRMEIEALKSLARHPHVLNLMDTYSTKNNTYLMTQFCDGDLSKHMKERKSIPLAEAASLIQQILTGYLAVHRAGYVHRDIKPANIFLKEGRVKLADFGFAVPLSELAHHQHYNVGSPQYMPPEALKDNLYSFSSDIWAVGVILYEMLKGCPPWKARSQQMLYSKLMNQPIDKMLQSLPPQCREFVGRALRIPVEERLTVQDVARWATTFQDVASRDRMLIEPALRPTLLSQQRENLFVGAPQMKKDSHSDNRSETSSAVASIPPLRQINLNSGGGVLTLQHTTSAINSAQPHPRRENSIPHHLSAKPSEGNRSPIREISLKGTFKTRYNAVTPKHREAGLPFDELMKVPQTAHQNQPISFPDARGEPAPATSTAEATVASYLNFCKFLYKLLQLISSPLKYEFPSAAIIQNNLSSLLNFKIKKLAELFEKGPSTALFIEGWSDFQASSGYAAAKAKVAQLSRKYGIMYPPVLDDRSSLAGSTAAGIQRGVHELMEHLRLSFDQKSVILLDYLTTVYQLLDLDRKYEPARFGVLSKIDIIVQGSPFSVSPQHLGRLLNKIAIIGV